MGDSFPVQDVALLRDVKHPTTFALVRGFDWSGEPITDWRRVDPYRLGLFFAQSVIPRMAAAGARPLGVFTPDDFQVGSLWTGQRMVSAIPGRPLPPQRSGVVLFAWFADTASYERHRRALEADPFWRETVAPRLAQFVTSMSTTEKLIPVGRSREFRDLLGRPW